MFYQRDPVTLSRALLGKILVRRLPDGTRLAGRIVEVEAYLGIGDRAAHTFGGRRTPRNESMWKEGGHAYVYFTYGMHYCMNVVAERAEIPTACLIRALEPVEGVEAMRRQRRMKREIDLCSGPAKLTQAMKIDRTLDGADLTGDDRLWIEKGPRVAPARIAVAPRIGVDYAGDWARRLLRFFVKNNPHVSRRA